MIFNNCLATFKKFKTATLLNMMGLSVAFAVFIVVATQLRHEFTYDTFYDNADNLYRMEIYDSITQRYSTACSVPMYELVADKVPGIEKIGMYALWERAIFSRMDEGGVKRTYAELRGFLSPDFVTLFSMNIVAGDARAALEDPQQCVMPEQMAQRIFGHENPMGKTVLMGESEWVVGAVYEDFPKNSSITNALYTKLEDRRWDMWAYVGFFELTPGVDVAEVNQKINDRHVVDFGSLNAEAAEHFGQDSERYTFALKPVKDIYFSQTVTFALGEAKTGNKTMSYLLMLIGVLTMVIAYVNFTNFSTALAPVRIKNINTRRVMGGSKGALRAAVMVEAATISFVSFVLSLLWVDLFSQSTLSTAFFDNPALAANIDILIAVGIASILLGLLAGLYPAVYMTSFEPALVLKGSFALSPHGIRLRNTLITIQFFTAIALITGASFIKLQHDYMQDQPIGMDRENIVVVNIIQEKTILAQLNAVTGQIMENRHVYDYTTAGNVPGSVGMNWGREIDGKTIQVSAWPVGHNFLRFFKIPIIEGEDFFEHNQQGVNKYIFNRKTINKFDLQDVIGKEMEGFPINRGTVTGIAADANFESLHRSVEPLVFVCGDDQPVWFLFFKIDAADSQATMAHIKNVCAKFSENEVIVRSLDEVLELLYRKEANLANMISLFSLIAIIISLMGIYGLIVFNAKFKVREIGIRKVNGASEMSIILLLNKGFINLIVLAFIISTPISVYLISQWLKSFPYRVSMYWWVFALAGIITLLITLFTVSYQSWKAAVQNPVHSLKNN